MYVQTCESEYLLLEYTSTCSMTLTGSIQWRFEVRLKMKKQGPSTEKSFIHNGKKKIVKSENLLF